MAATTIIHNFNIQGWDMDPTSGDTVQGRTPGSRGLGRPLCRGRSSIAGKTVNARWEHLRASVGIWKGTARPGVLRSCGGREGAVLRCDVLECEPTAATILTARLAAVCLQKATSSPDCDFVQSKGYTLFFERRPMPESCAPIDECPGHLVAARTTHPPD